MQCDNCQQPLVDHCRVHLIPCCPGKCPAEQPREWIVTCSATASCGWEGVRSAVSQRDAQTDRCPNCGNHVRAHGVPPQQNGRGPAPAPSPSRYHLL